MRICYADPPYPGQSAKHYADHPDYAGEVDLNELVAELYETDGWILHTSSTGVGAVAFGTAPVRGAGLIKRTPLKRKTPLRSKSARSRRVKETCSRLRCTRKPIRDLGICATHAKQEADRLFSLLVRAAGNGCAECGRTDTNQCAHILSRSYLAIRYSTSNAVVLCASHHVYFTHRPLEWEAWVDYRWPRLRTALRERALTYEKPDYAALVPSLRAQLAALRKESA